MKRRDARCWICNSLAPIERVTSYPQGVLFRDRACVSVHYLCVYHFHEHRGDLRAAKRHGEPTEGVRHRYTWKLCDYRHHALCVRCLRQVEDAVELDEEGDVACSDMLVAESVMQSARIQQAGVAGRLRDVVAMATEDYREARSAAYAHHRKAMATLRAQHEAARAKGPEA